MSHEWETLKEMGVALKLPHAPLYRNTKGWIEERDEVDAASQETFKEQAIAANAASSLAIYQNLKPMMEALFVKGINHLLAKRQVRKPNGTVVMEDIPFSSDGTAIAAARLGFAAMKILERGELPDPGSLTGHGNGKAFVIDAETIDPTFDPKTFSSQQLKDAIAAIGDTEEGAEKDTARGAAAKGRGGRKGN